MKITDQSVPPEFEAEFAKLFNWQRASDAPTGAARTSILVPISTRSARVTRHPDDWEKAATYIANNEKRLGNINTWQAIYDLAFTDLRDGVFTAPFWQERFVIADDHFANSPVSVPRITTKPYAYRDPSNLPTIPTYGTGTSATGALFAEGLTSGGYYHDNILHWRRYVADITDGGPIADTIPVFWKITGSIYGEASTRGARPIMAAVSEVRQCQAGDPQESDLNPPVYAPRYINVRYERDPASPPYWSQTQTLQAVITAKPPLIYATGDPVTRAVLKLAPAPLMGQWFNNNTYTKTTLYPTVQCFAYAAGGFIEWANNLSLSYEAPYDNSGPPWSNANGWLADGGESSQDIPLRMALGIRAIRSHVTGYTSYGGVGFYPAAISNPGDDPLTGFDKYVFVGGDSSAFIIAKSPPGVPFDFGAAYACTVRVNAFLSPSLFPSGGGLDVRIG